MIASITEEDRQAAIEEFKRTHNVCGCCVIHQVMRRVGIKHPFTVSGGDVHNAINNGISYAVLKNKEAIDLSWGTSADWTPDIVGTPVIIELTPEGWKQ